MPELALNGGPKAYEVTFASNSLREALEKIEDTYDYPIGVYGNQIIPSVTGATARQLALVSTLEGEASTIEAASGTLMASGTVDPPVGVRERGQEMEVTVAYNLVYAARRHEETDAVISKAQEGRQAKYLETAAKEREKTYGAHIADEVKREL